MFCAFHVVPALVFVCIMMLAGPTAVRADTDCALVGQLRDSFPILQSLWTQTNCCEWQTTNANIVCGTTNPGGLQAPPDAVSQIFIQNLQLSGPLPAALGELPHLWKLDLFNVGFNGDLPAFYSTKWLRVELRNTQLNISQWSDSFGIVKLVSNPRLSGRLLDLVMKNCSFRPLHLVHLENQPLVTGEFTSNFTDICTGIRFFYFENTPIEGTLEPLVPLAKLQQVILKNMPLFTGGIPDLPDTVTHFQVEKCPNISDDIFVRLASCCRSVEIVRASASGFYGNFPADIGFMMPNLTVVDVSFNNLNESIPASLMTTQLTELNLSYNNFSGDVPLPLPRTLTKLFLQGSINKNYLVSDQLINDVTHLPQLTNLILNGQSGFIGVIPANFSSLALLVEAQLSACNFSGTIDPSWGSMPNLASINLSGNKQISGTIPVELGNATRLSMLQLDNLSLSNPLPDSFGNLTRLEHLNVGNNLKLNGTFPSWIQRVPTLKFLGLSNNEFSGLIPSWLNDMSSLTTLYLNNNNFTGCPQPFFQVTKACQIQNNPWDTTCPISKVCFPPPTTTCGGGVCSFNCEATIASSCIVHGSVNISSDSTTSFTIDSPVVVTGNLTINSGVVVQFVLDTTAATQTVQVDQCLNLQSNQLQVQFGQNANLTTFNRSVLVSWSAACSQVPDNIQISSNLDQCNPLSPKIEVQTDGSRGQLALIFVPRDSTPSACTPPSEAVVLTTGATIGIAVGAAAFFVIAIVVIVFSVKAIRRKAMPFRDRKAATSHDTL